LLASVPSELRDAILSQFETALLTVPSDTTFMDAEKDSKARGDARRGARRRPGS
jgi:hypothetical protein